MPDPMQVRRTQPADSVLHNLLYRMQSLGQSSSTLLRYVVLSTLAFFFLTAPVSFREVSHAGHRSAPRA